MGWAGLCAGVKVLLLAGWIFGVQTASSQEPATTTVQGVVKNAATGDPLPRALVRIEGDAYSGALTDGEGRFEIPRVPVGPQVFQLVKPGFHDVPSSPMGAGEILQGSSNLSHQVYVAAGMQDLAFAMAPANVIRGQVQLSTGDPAQGIRLMLLERTIQEGRAFWRPAGSARTDSDGQYRFAALRDGSYVVEVEPAMETEAETAGIDPGSSTVLVRRGYPMVFYPDVRDFSGAAHLDVSGGQQSQANFSLALEPFYLVKVAVRTAGTAVASGYTAAVLDPQGHQLPYPAQYDEATRTLQALLPSGNYTLRVSALRGDAANHMIAGQEDVSVENRPIVNLRMALAPETSSPLSITVARSGTASASSGKSEGISVLASQASPLSDGMVSQFATGTAPGILDTTGLAPGAYWMNTVVLQTGLCESSFTAGGVNLAHEPLTVGAGGTTAPLLLALRDDCSTLRVSLPATAMARAPGEETAYQVYVVPDFEATAAAPVMTLRPSTSGSVAWPYLTPGNYHVYTFAAPIALEYRNPAALAALPGQAVTLQPGETSDLVIDTGAQ